MPLEMPYEDLHRDLRGCVVMYKNKPVYVVGIGRDGDIAFIDLVDQKPGNAPFTIKDFTNPVRRVGFVNCYNSVVYVSRIPYRKYYMGLHVNNTLAKILIGVDYEHGAGLTKERVRNLCCAELGAAIMDKYPSFQDACKQVKKYPGACAFDKQFCITSRGHIYYKGESVGTCNFKTAKGIQDIKWNKGKEHLILLLDGNYEKTVRDFGPKA